MGKCFYILTSLKHNTLSSRKINDEASSLFGAADNQDTATQPSNTDYPRWTTMNRSISIKTTTQSRASGISCRL